MVDRIRFVDDPTPVTITIENTRLDWSGLKIIFDWATQDILFNRIALNITLTDGTSMTLNLTEEIN